MKDSVENANSDQPLPEARVQRNPKTWFFWLVPIAAAALAAYFIYAEKVRGGPKIYITFDTSSGLQSGKSDLKYRGAKVGDVKNVKLTKDQQHVEIEVELSKSAAGLAREGSRFWVVKPEVGMQQITGLRTIVSGDYLTVEPGGGKKQTHFVGLPDAPIVEGEDVLKITILSERGGTLKKRTPVYYRGIEVGEVFSSDLGPESQTIQSVVHIKRHYAPLVRINSKFWNAGGIHMNLSLSGLNIGAQSAETLLSGGIDFATPDTLEKEAKDGTVYRLFDKPQTDWLAWAPVIRLNPQTNAPPEQASYNSQP